MKAEPYILDERLRDAVSFFRAVVDEDDLDNHQAAKDVWERLTSFEQLQVQGQMKDKVPGTNRMYASLLGDYLSHEV